MVYDWLLTEDHVIYKQKKRTLKYKSVASLINDINFLNLCEGANDENNKKGKVVYHAVPQKYSDSDSNLEIPMQPYNMQIISKYVPLTQSGHHRLVISLKVSRLKCHQLRK